MATQGKSAPHQREAKQGRFATATARRSIDAARASVAKGLSAAAALRRAALELVFPGTCISCHAELNCEDVRSDVAGLPLCQACFDELDLLGEPVCRRCGAPLPRLSAQPLGAPNGSSKPRGCFRCDGPKSPKLWFDETIAAGLYTGRLREMLLGMKRAEGDPLSLAVGQLVWKRCRERLAALEADVVAPIASHWRRRLEHRTNSAAVLAEVLADRLRLPLAEGLLRRRRHTVRQFELTPPQRWKNVQHAFSVRAGYHLSRAHVLLVDDILTTGATCSEAARTLRGAGAERVTVVVAARAIG